ncbi:MAG: hypothetical protein FD153_33 [Rhodospirillaceae bacterium]|nr:MAG: hypothetical protein FD153_33 [Rhodospirillaceae bacterium]
MAHFRKIPVVIEASQWWHHGDHPAVRPAPLPDGTIPERGWIETLEGPHTVPPGDWIITGVAGEHYPCKPHIFSQTYEPADEGTAAKE